MAVHSKRGSHASVRDRSTTGSNVQVRMAALFALCRNQLDANATHDELTP